MSVLFKALAKAARARGSTMGAAPSGQPAILAGGRSRGGNKRGLVLGGVLLVAAGAVGYMFLPDDEPAPRPVRLAHPILQPGGGAPGAAKPAPAPSAVADNVPASAPPPAAPAPAPSLPPPGAGPVIAAAPPPPAAAPAAEARPSPVKPTPAPVPPSAAKPQPAVAAPAQPGIRPVEEDLPTVLARLRREKTEAAVSQPVKVARAAPRRQLLDEDGNPSIQVGTSPQAAQDAARAAYDALLDGRYEEALAGYDRALAVEKDSPAIYLGKAAALQKLGRLAEARKAYERVLALEPANREALTNMTTLMAAQAPDRALADLRALRKANPGFSPIDAAIGTQEAALGDGAAALEALGQAVAEAPGNGIYRLDLAIVQDRAGLAADAAASYQAALALLAGGEAGLPLPLDQVRRRLAYLEKR